MIFISRGQSVLFAAGVSLALAFTFGCSSGDEGGGNGSSSSPSSSPSGGDYSKDSCIKTEVEIEDNTLDDVTKICNATRNYVLSQLPDSIGSCRKNDLAFNKPIKYIMKDCNADYIYYKEKWCVVEFPDTKGYACYKIYPESEYLWAQSEMACRLFGVANPNVKVSDLPNKNECPGGWYDGS